MLSMEQTRRLKLKKLLQDLSDDEEKKEIDKLEKLYSINTSVKDLSKKGDFSQGEIKTALKSLDTKISSIKIPKTDFTPVVEALGEINKAVSRPQPDLIDYSPTYKSIIAGLAEVDKSIKDKPVPVWQWPQYAGVNIRDRSFSQINPATDGIGIGSFDYVARVLTNSTTETYTFRTGGATGTIVATIVVVYTDSTLATLLSVTKTPVTLQ